MDLRKYFSANSDKIRAELERSKSLRHNTAKGDVREDAVVDVLANHLPKRYALDRGEIVSSHGGTSKQCDAVIYDEQRCPPLFMSEPYKVFPVESVYGVMEVKSTLSSSELERAHQNIVSAKRLASGGAFLHAPGPGLHVPLARPEPVGCIVSYDADRSLDAVARQLRQLNAALPSPRVAPDFVFVIGQGYIGPSERTRDYTNQLRGLSDDERHMVHKAGRHTLLILYMRLFEEINQMTLETPNMRAYLKAPVEMGGHLVSNHVLFFTLETGKTIQMEFKESSLMRVRDVARASGSVPLRESLKHRHKDITDKEIDQLSVDELAICVYEYNPRRLPPAERVGERIRLVRPGTASADVFIPAVVKIDDEEYHIDIGALSPDDFNVVGDESREEYYSLYLMS